MQSKAHTAVYLALKSGELVRPGHCTDCREHKRLDGHHEDYAKALEVIWVCRKCHDMRHRIAKTGKYKPRQVVEPFAKPSGFSYN